MNTGNIINKTKLSPVDMESRRKLKFKAGDAIKVWSNILEEKYSTKSNKKVEKTLKTRIQVFEGIVLCRKHGSELGATFTVRKIASRIGVERIFPLYSPSIQKIEILRKSKARRSKLYYIRDKALKQVRKKLRSFVAVEEEVATKKEDLAVKTE